MNHLHASSSIAGRRGDGMRRTQGTGFTLIELMIVVAIIALLAAVAYPAYTDSVVKGKRSQGRAALMDLLQQQERYLTQTGSYMSFGAGATGANGTTAGASTVAIPFKTRSGDDPSQGAYSLGARACAGTPAVSLSECVVVFAQPTFSDAAAGNLEAQSTGAKSCTGTKPAVCWK